MQNGLSYFLAGVNKKDVVQESKAIQITRSIFQMNYLCVAVLIMCLSGLNFAQTRGDGATPKMTQPGAPAGSYSLSGFENVNLFNGNLNFNLPLVKIGGRGKAQSSVNLSIDSARWNVEQDTNSSAITLLSGGGFWRIANLQSFTVCVRAGGEPDECNTTNEIVNEVVIDGRVFSNAPGSSYTTIEIKEDTCAIRPGYGPGVVIGRGGKFGSNRNFRGDPMSFFTLTRLYFIASNGTEYELRDTSTDGKPVSHREGTNLDRGTIFTSPDGSGLKFVSNSQINDVWNFDVGACPSTISPSGTLYFPDGTRYDVVNGTVRQIRDINGNYIN